MLLVMLFLIYSHGDKTNWHLKVKLKRKKGNEKKRIKLVFKLVRGSRLALLPSLPPYTLSIHPDDQSPPPPLPLSPVPRAVLWGKAGLISP